MDSKHINHESDPPSLTSEEQRVCHNFLDEQKKKKKKDQRLIIPGFFLSLYIYTYIFFLLCIEHNKTAYTNISEMTKV